MENWLPVVGWEGIYEVSNLGRVKRSIRGTGTKAGRLLKPYVGNHGYSVVSLNYQGRKECRTIHRLVTIAFIGPCPDKLEVNHKDGVRANCAVSNLEYLTRNDNLIHAFRVLGRTRNGKKGITNSKAKLSEKQVLEIRRRYSLGGVSRQDLAQEFGVTRSTIAFITQRRSWRHLP